MDTLDCSTIALGNRASLIAKLQLPCIASQPCKITQRVNYGSQQVYEAMYSKVPICFSKNSFFVVYCLHK